MRKAGQMTIGKMHPRLVIRVDQNQNGEHMRHVTNFEVGVRGP